jgi:hypothetical protein
MRFGDSVMIGGIMRIGGIELSDLAVRRYEFLQDGVGHGNYSAWDLIAMLDNHQIDADTQIRPIGYGKGDRLSNLQVYKHADKLRPFGGHSVQVMIFDSLERLRLRFVWFSIGIGILIAVLLLFGVRVYTSN